MKKIKLLLPLLVLSLGACEPSTKKQDEPEDVRIIGYEKKDDDYHTVKKSDGTSNTESHSWDNGEITLEATETTDGVKTYNCKLCDAQKTEKIPSTGIPHTHSWSENWSKDTNNHWKECTDTTCDEKNSMGAHTWNNGVVTTAATTTTDGVKTYTCTVCQQTKTEKIPATGGGQQVHTHTWASSWTTDDNYHWKKCTDATCNEINSKAAHTWNSGTVTTPATATTDGVKTYACTVCQKTKTEKIPATGGGQVSTDPFTVTTDLTTVKEIHTSQQKTYLAYTGDYATMDPNNYPDGSKLLSDSLPVDLAWNHTAKSGKTLKNYSVTFGQKSDLSDGYEVVGNTLKSIQLYNTFLGTNYFKINANYTDNSVESSNIKTFKVDETTPRNLAIGGMTNCRDMGGRTTITGAKVKQGLIYRTCGNKFDYSTTITDAGKTVMLKQLGVKTEINIADGTSYDVKLNGTTTYDCKMDYAKTNGVSKHHFSRNAESVKNVFKILADESKYPVYYHCRIGTDRTGLVGNLVYGLVGVPINMIYQDYLFSNFGKIGEKRYIGSKAGQDDISIYMEEINSMPGANFQEKTYNTLLSIGVPKATLDKVIDILTDGTQCDNDQGQIAVNANNLVLSGTTATYTARNNLTDRSEPEYYAKMSANASASYTIETTEAGKAYIYGYLGHNEHSSSKTISGSLKVSVDGAEISVPTTTFQNAGMGNIDSRTNYYFVKLGEVSNLSAGSHTITVTGKANDMKLGTLSIFGVSASAGEQGQGSDNPGGGNTETTETVIANFKANTETAKSTVDVVTNNSGTYYKITGDNGYIEYKFNSTVAGKATLKALVGTKAGNATSEHSLWFDGSNAKIKFEVNGTNVAITDSKTTFADAGMTKSSAGGSGDSNVPVWVSFPEISVVEGENTFRITRTGGYSLYFYEFKVVC